MDKNEVLRVRRGPEAPDGLPPEHWLVVVGLDDSAGGFLAAEAGAREARLRGWPLRIVHVQDTIWGTHNPDAAHTTASDLLADAAERVRALDPELAVSTQVRAGSPAGELVRASHESGLVVVGGRGQGGFAELLAGSVSTHVATYASTPVLIARQLAGATGPQRAGQPIVVGVDGSPAAEAAFGFAVAEARLRGLGVVAVYATTAAPGDSADPLHSGVLAETATARLGPPLARRRVGTDPRTALVALSAEATAVVVGSRGRGGFPGLRSGSVAQALIRQADCPVFVVHRTSVGLRHATAAVTTAVARRMSEPVGRLGLAGVSMTADRLAVDTPAEPAW